MKMFNFGGFMLQIKLVSAPFKLQLKIALS